VEALGWVRKKEQEVYKKREMRLPQFTKEKKPVNGKGQHVRRFSPRGGKHESQKRERGETWWEEIFKGGIRLRR